MEHTSGQPNVRVGRLDVTMEAGRDQLHQQVVAISNSSLPVTYQPFKFENRRLRIDWRLLHGVDINRVVRDTDLDALERLVSCITWGDIEAEDTRHLSEANFVKIFRLAQLLLEYLLYVQDNLKYTNCVLEQSRSAALVNVQTINARCSELQGQLKLCRKELRSTRKTVKSLELLAAAVKAGVPVPAATQAQAAVSPSVNVSMQATLQEQQPNTQLHQQQYASMQHNTGMQPQQQVQPIQQQLQTVGAYGMTAGEMLLQNQLTELTDRMAVAGCELERLREEREELQYQVRYLYDMLVAKTGGEKSSQRHFSPIRSAMLASRASGSPHSWRRQYGDKYEAAAAAEAEAAAAAAAEEEIVHRTAEIKHQLEQQIKQFEVQFEQQLQEQKQQSEQELQKQQVQLQQKQEELQRRAERIQHLEMQMEQADSRLEHLQQENQELRSQLSEASSAPKTGDSDALVASLREQLNDKIRECIYLQGELSQRESSIATFKQANELLEREIEELQKEKVSPDATTPSFVAKQRKSIALAETKADKLQQQVADLQHENTQLMQQVAGLRAKLAGGSGSAVTPDDPVAAAERLLANTTDSSSSKRASTASADKAWEQVAELKQEKLVLVQQVEELKTKLGVQGCSNPQQQSGEWKLQEIKRLQNDNRLLQQKVTSLQEQCNDLERMNAQLQRQITKAQTSSSTNPQEPTANTPTGSALAAAIAASGVGHASSWARGSVASAASAASSGPKQELTAADLAAVGMSVEAEPDLRVTAAAAHAEEQQSGNSDVEHEQAAAAAAVRSVVVRPAAVQHKKTAETKADTSWIWEKKKEADPAAGQIHDDGDADVKIPAYRPSAEQQEPQQQGQSPAEPTLSADPPPAANPSSTSAISGTSSTASGGHISQEAAAQMKALMAQIAALPQDKLTAEYKEFCEDWDTPFDLSVEEKDWFGTLLPYQVPGQMGLLTATPHTADEYAAHHGRLLVQINKQLDAQLASFGIHPGRTGLNNTEFMAAMGMLNERRQAWEGQLSPELKQQVEAARCGILLHPYNITQQILQQQLNGPDGKKHLPRVMKQSLTSAVRPPASMLPAGPAAIRVSAAAQTHTRASQLVTGSSAGSPGLGSRYQHTTALDSDNESLSPTRYHHQETASPASPGAIPSGPLGAGMSPVKASAAAAALQVASRAASYSTATFHAESASGRTSPELSQQWSQVTAVTAPGVGYSPMSAALQKKPSPRGPAPSMAARMSAAAAAGVAPAAGIVNSLEAGNMQSGQQQGTSSAVPGAGPSKFAASHGGSDSGNAMNVGQQSQAQGQAAGKATSSGMAAAFKQYLGNSLDESGEF